MCVLIEGINVVVLREALERSYPGGVEGYRASCPNATFCADDQLVRVGFMTPPDVEAWVRQLEANGLRFIEAGRCVEIAVVDQQTGPTALCDWLSFGRQPADEELDGSQSGSYMVAWRSGTEPTWISVPEGWTFEKSLSKSFSFVPTESVEKDLKYFGREGDLDVYLDTEGNKKYVGRTSRIERSDLD